MPPSYEVVLIHQDLGDFAREVAEAIRNAANDVLVRPDLLEIKYDLSSVGPDSHVVVVYLGSTVGRRDDAVTAALEDALSRPFPVLPIVRKRELGSIREKLPTVIENINAADWDKESVTAMLTLLGMLGLVETERKVFCRTDEVSRHKWRCNSTRNSCDVGSTYFSIDSHFIQVKTSRCDWTKILVTRPLLYCWRVRIFVTPLGWNTRSHTRTATELTL